MQLTEWRWRACLGVLGGWLLNISLYFALQSAEVYGSASYWDSQHHRGIWISLYVAVAFIVVASILDVAMSVRRDWLHNLAVFTILCDSINNSVMFRLILWQWWSEFVDYFGG